MSDLNLSDLKLERKECPKCGAVWMNGQHYWRTGAIGSDLDLAGLVCNNYGDNTCINPLKGREGGDTWDDRFVDLTNDFADLHKKMNDEYEKD
tara:strand:- start:2770 stop:3048 length:279 start_codon:yes stop_codon:yes gene_type:complete